MTEENLSKLLLDLAQKISFQSANIYLIKRFNNRVVTVKDIN